MAAAAQRLAVCASFGDDSSLWRPLAGSVFIIRSASTTTSLGRTRTDALIRRARTAGDAETFGACAGTGVGFRSRDALLLAHGEVVHSRVRARAVGEGGERM